MRRFIIALAFLLAGLSPALAQHSSIIGGGVYGDTKAASASYTGPGDIVASATSWYSCSRAYSSATRGNKVCNVCNPGDAACADISSDASTGIVAAPTIGGVICDNSTHICTVKTAYNQAAAGLDATQATIANRPTLLIQNNGSAKVAMACLNSAHQLLGYNAGAATSAAPYTIVAVALRAAPIGSNTAFGLSNNVGGNQGTLGFYAISGDMVFDDAGNTIFPTGITENAIHNMTGLGGNGASSNMYVDGTAFGPFTGGTTAPGESVGICAGNYAASNSDWHNGTFFEAGDWPVGFTGTQVTNMNTNTSTFY